MSAPVLSPHFVFGCNSSVTSGLSYLDETTILYSAGHNIVIYSIDTRQQRFIPLTDVNGAFGRTEICSLAVSHSRRFIAVGERGAERGLISIFDLRTLKKRRILTCPDVRSREYLSLAFSADSRILLSLSGGPEYLSIAWDWQKAKPIQFAQINNINTAMSAQHISFSNSSLDVFSSLPGSPSASAGGPGAIAVTGRNLLEIYSAAKEVEKSEDNNEAANVANDVIVPASLSGLAKFQSISLRSSLSSLPDDVDLLCQLWIKLPPDGKHKNRQFLICGTATGALLMFSDSGSYLCSLSTASNSPAPKAICSLAAFNNGFVAGCDSGILLIYQFAPPASSSEFVLFRSLFVESAPCRIVHLSVSPSHEHLLLLTETQQILTLKNFNSDVLNTRDVQFAPLISSFHHGSITGASTCVRKPIIATCGLDRTIRIWNYITRTLELTVQFPEPALSLSLHPSGLHLLVGFADKLRLMNILMDDIRPYKEFSIKACSECAFSNGGHLFAACHVGLIQVYNSYTCEQIAVFRGHTGLIKSIFWSADDTKIVSAGLDGAVYERRLNSNAIVVAAQSAGPAGLSSPSSVAASNVRTQEHVQKGCKFSSALCTEDERIYAVGDDKMLKEIVDKNVNKTLDAGVVLTQLCVAHATPQRMLFAGTINGVIRSFAFPLTGVVKDYQAHCRSVTRLRLSANDQVIFSTGEDGILAIFRVRADSTGAADEWSGAIDGSAFSEEILVHRSDLEEKNSLMVELRSKVDELTASNEYQLRLHDMNYQEKLREVSDKYNAQLEHDRSRIEMLRDEKAELESECEEKLNQLKLAQASQLHAEDMSHQREIMKQVEHYQKAQQRLEALKAAKAREASQIKENYRQQFERLKEETSRAFLTETEATMEEKNMSQLVRREFEETKSQLENDFDREIEALKEKFEKKLHLERDATLRLKGENGIMNKKFASLEKEIADQEESIAMLKEKEGQLKVHCDLLDERIAAHKAEIRDRDRIIGENERTIYDLKRDNQELEKFKFVLDYQIRELKRQIEPRENEISEMKENVTKIDGQLEEYHKENSTLKQTIASIHESLSVKQKEIARSRQQERAAVSRFQAGIRELTAIAQSFIQQPKELAKKIKALNEAIKRADGEQRAAASSAASVSADGQAVEGEFKRQREYLETSTAVLRARLTREMKARKSENIRIMQENVALIKEINKMRREIKLIKQVQRQKELHATIKHSERADPIEAAVPASAAEQEEAEKLAAMQKTQIVNLRMAVEAIKKKTKAEQN